MDRALASPGVYPYANHGPVRSEDTDIGLRESSQGSGVDQSSTPFDDPNARSSRMESALTLLTATTTS